MFKFMPKIFSVVILVGMLASCGTTSTTVGLIKVVDKEQSERDSYWIKVEDLGNHPEEVRLKVNNENTWNLILIGELYAVSYDFKTKDKNKHTGKLTSIRPAAQPK
ncbi:hypothetical protein PghCCS26_13690 [Paenibacillus glycanilyticus]|uniref:DUF3221 domain-containing protein n=1 Tax=Paenibacillus glycanilyticus TaxID=126569 RepID=A0ABQ6NJ70_9BACL|nr:hypothetical protein [Paenibacillus glycanilyticus]GMK44242.1 hypothetical protein PghCCS26_13690 [Paenibacillus glycanilyticus]